MPAVTFTVAFTYGGVLIEPVFVMIDRMTGACMTTYVKLMRH